MKEWEDKLYKLKQCYDESGVKSGVKIKVKDCALICWV
jgi:hypothetical protein